MCDSAESRIRSVSSRIRSGAAIAVILLSLLAGAAPTRAAADGSSANDSRPPAPPPSDSRPDAMIETMKSPVSWTGAVSEEEFKAMHTLRGDSLPPLLGQAVEVAGTAGYLSLPAGAEAPLPGVVVIHEWWGLNDHIRYWSDRLAALGYAALAVDLYGGRVATSPDSAMAYVKQVDAEQSGEILLAAERFLMDDSRVKATRTGSIGWCFGGGKSLQLALSSTELDACVIYYGHPVTDPEQLKRIRCPVLGIFATRDKSITPEMVKEFDEALTKAGVKHEIVSFDADHAFANPSGGRYDEKTAAQAWEKVQPFLEENLKEK